jgi:hypothetical protein
MTTSRRRSLLKKICFIGKGITFDSGGYSPAIADGGHEGRYVRRRAVISAMTRRELGSDYRSMRWRVLET